MKKTLPFLSILIFLPFFSPFLFSAPSRPAPAPSESAAALAPEIDAYNAGCKLLKKKKWAEAQKQFELALKAKEAFPEAHNNLAFVLRVQSPQNFDESLVHYNRAIELAPKMPEPYMYRGALYFAMGKKDLAQADYETLKKMKSSLAKHLKEVMDTGKEELDEFYGISKPKW
ncbi:MAG TPA: tetratricopeptide repeat protein [Opitutaceae bacterium]|nr:tetratricopeptide repeat protein [Opitutaceae bacterium]